MTGITGMVFVSVSVNVVVKVHLDELLACMLSLASGREDGATGG